MIWFITNETSDFNSEMTVSIPWLFVKSCQDGQCAPPCLCESFSHQFSDSDLHQVHLKHLQLNVHLLYLFSLGRMGLLVGAVILSNAGNKLDHLLHRDTSAAVLNWDPSHHFPKHWPSLAALLQLCQYILHLTGVWRCISPNLHWPLQLQNQHEEMAPITLWSLCGRFGCTNHPHIYSRACGLFLQSLFFHVHFKTKICSAILLFMLCIDEYNNMY